MEVKETLTVSQSEFYDTLIQSVLHDIKNALGDEITEADLSPGFSYNKKMKNQLGQEGNVHVTIVQLSRPQQYEARFQSSQGINTVSYELRELSEQQVEVRYLESFEGKNTSSSLNYRLLSGFYQRRAKKRMAGMLHSMEAFIRSKEMEQAT